MKVKSVIVPEFLEGGGRIFAERRLIQIAASIAARSERPFAKAIRDYYSGEYLDVTDYTEGEYLSGVIGGNTITIRSGVKIYSGDSYIGCIEIV
jgi:cation transport ATPase